MLKHDEKTATGSKFCLSIFSSTPSAAEAVASLAVVGASFAVAVDIAVDAVAWRRWGLG